MAKKVYKCTFSNVNGENTGSFTRTQMTKNSPSPGILYKKNCPDNLTFYVDPDDGGVNSYYKLIQPSDYNLSGSSVYVWLSRSYLLGWELVDNPYEAPPAPEPEPKVQENRAVDTFTTYARPSDNIDLAMQSSSNHSIIYNASGRTLTDPVYRYGSFTQVNRTNFSNDYYSFINNINTVEGNLNIALNPTAAAQMKNDLLTKFNRFKIATPNSALGKSFAHVFFTRPALNLYKDHRGTTLLDTVDADPYFYYLHRNSPDLLKSLTDSTFSLNHKFNPYLSNKSGSFELKDEYIETDEYGESLTGWKVKYGKNNIKSKTADSFSIQYTDDNNYNVLKLHKAWVDYISNVYRGIFPIDRQMCIVERALDYASSVYYMLCGPDGETLLFWTKYTGVFPTLIPSGASSWTSGQLLANPTFQINYEYSWKEDMNPTSLAEFNLCSKQDANYRYAKTYEPELGSTGKTFVNAPYVETVVDRSTGKYEFKLRFRP